jgi:hypothetical protein
MFRQVCIAASLFFVVASATAQETPVAPAQKTAPPRTGGAEVAVDTQGMLPPAQLVAMLDTYAIVQAQEQLSIPDEKYGVFAARLKKLQDVRRRNQRLRHQIVQELRRLAGPRAPVPGDESAIRSQLAALRAHDERAMTELRQAYDQLDEVLDARQQARFRMFEEVIEQRKLDLLVRARERTRQNRLR